MMDQRSLALALYAGVAGVLLLAGYVYKEIRDHREHRKNPKLPFDRATKEEKDQRPPLVASSSRR